MMNRLRWIRGLLLWWCVGGWWGCGTALMATQEAAALPGLLMAAKDGAHEATLIMPVPHFALTADQSLHPALPPAFQATWTGYLQIPRAGAYQFQGPIRLRIAGQEYLGRPLTLSAGPVAVELAYTRTNPLARLQWLWQADGFKAEPVPALALSHRPESAVVARTALWEAGYATLREYNCAACHAGLRRGTTNWYGPILTGAGTRLQQAWMGKWLENPRRFRPHAVMPVVLSEARDLADVAAYLASLKEPPRALAAESVRITPERRERGQLLYETIGCTGCHGDDLLELKGLGSKQTVGALADYLAAPLAIDPSGRMPDLLVTREEAEALAAYLSKSFNPDYEPPAPPGDATRGRQLVQTSGCLNCHTLADGDNLVSTLKAPDLNQFVSGRGCLSDKPPGGAAQYGLSPEQQRELSAALQWPAVNPAPWPELQRWVRFYRCDGCHEFFRPATVRFPLPPPPLTLSGAKLRPPWLAEVLLNKKRIRPWLGVRMPHYGETAIRPVMPLVPSTAGWLADEDSRLAPGSLDQIQAGIKLMGRTEGGFSCISCHDFRGRPSGTEVRGPDLVEMHARLRAEWALQWLRDPPRLLPGTGMPAFFRELPVAQAERMMALLLQTLAAGPAMPDPIGLAPAK